MMLRRMGLAALGLLLLMVVLVGGAAAWITWFPNSLKPMIERVASAKLGREVRIEGPLAIELGRETTIDLRGLRIAAPDWAEADNLLSLEHLRVGFDVLAYLRDRALRIPELVVEQPVLALERDAEGRASWPSGNGGGKSGPLPKVELGRLALDAGQASFKDAARNIDVHATLAGSDRDIAGDATGNVGGKPLRASLRLAGLRETLTGSGPVRVDGSLSALDAEVSIDGEIRDPAALDGIGLSVRATAEQPAAILVLLGQAAPAPLPPLKASARVTGNQRVYGLEAIQARLGESDLTGQLRLDLGQARPRLEGNLRSEVLDLAALQPTDASSRAPPNWGNPLRPIAGYSGRVAIEAGKIKLPQGPALTDSAVTLTLEEEKLTAAPLRIGLPGGPLTGEIATGPLSADRLTLNPRLKAAGVDVGGLASAGYGGRIDAKLEGSLLLAPPAESLAASRLHFEGAGADLAVPQARLGSFTGTAELADGRLRVEPLQLALPQGEVGGRVTAGPFDRDFAAQVDLAVKKVDLAAIARVEGVAGRLDGRLAGTVRGTQPLDILTRSTLTLKGTVSSLQLPQIERRVGSAEIDASLDPERREALKIAARAAAGDRTLNLAVFGGSAGTLAENRGDYPFTIVSELGKNEIKVNGTVSLPLTERRFAATIEAKGPDPSPILALFDLPKLQIPPYRLAGVFTNHRDELQIKDFDGKVGDSDLAANLVIDTSGERPKIVGQARSKVLDADDLGGLVGARPGTGPGETASPGQQAEAQQDAAKPTVLPDEPIDPARWRRVDLDLRVAADRIHAGNVPLDGFSGQVTMDDGLLRISEMDLTIGEGHLTGSIEADGRHDPVIAQVDLGLRRVSVARLFNRLDVDVAAFGTLSGQAQGGVGLGGSGRSIKDILGRSNGQIRLQMEGGQVDRTIVAALGLDLLRLLGAATGASPETVSMRCALASLDVKDGIVATDPLVIDTEIAELGGRGTIDLKSETIDLALTARPKETPLLTDLTGISVGGRLGKPEIAINPVALVARGVAAATLGIVLKPFTSLAGAAEEGSPSPCAELARAAGR